MSAEEHPPHKPPATPNLDGLVKAMAPSLEALSKTSAKSIAPTLDALSKSMSRDIVKAAMPNFGALAKIGLGRTDIMREVLPSPTLSADFYRWEAEKQAAPVVTRDAVLALGDSVEALIDADRTSAAVLIQLTVWIIRLTVVLVVIGALSLALTAYLIFA
jgi:hypothetical protein